jgi:hypothetical protein
LPGIETRFLGCPVQSVVSITTKLSRPQLLTNIYIHMYDSIKSWLKSSYDEFTRNMVFKETHFSETCSQSNVWKDFEYK